MNEQAKAWIDYLSNSLHYYVEPLDNEGCVKNVDFDKAIYASQINLLVNLRKLIDGPTPIGYTEAKPAYLHDKDLQYLRKNK